jgi:kinesin family protein 18/19
MGKRVKDQTFAFDRVFDENTTQDEVYESTTRPLLDSVMDGFNATVFAYGATGCGKTHTITGTRQAPGIIFLTMQELFEKIEEKSDEKVTEISLSYLEIYNETIRDLLVPGGSTQSLMLREDANQAVSVAGLTSHRPKDVNEVMEMIMKGNECRTVSPTEANAVSSRSHAVLQINVAQKDRNADINEPHTMATLSIIDLAGSERASATKNRGARLLEGANINKSLLALGSCINALCDPRQKNHVPYRNSKLTRLLKFSLGGNCRTVMIVCVSPSSQHFDETQNTLRYANRAKNIQTKVTRNVFNVNRHVKDYLVKIDEQMALINELRAQQKDFEALAFAKFKKQTDKRDGIIKDGIARIRSAFEASAPERQEKVNNMKKQRQIEKRISVLSGWIAAFDGICDAREDEAMPASLSAMRKTAQGILVELENSRHHYHQRLSKSNWERAIDSALQNTVSQLKDSDSAGNESEAANLAREVELLKANASREALHEVVEMEKGGDAEIMQLLLSAQLETITSLHDILAMDPEEAVEHAKTVLTRLLNSCSSAASQVIKPDGSLNIMHAVPPTKRGTPKRKKVVQATPSDWEKSVPIMAPLSAVPPQVFASPMKASPRRRKVAVVKKGVAFTPKKKSPSKRSVRWRDDADAGALADFEKTPLKFDSTPEVSSDNSLTLPTMPAVPAYLAAENNGDSADSSPVPQLPQPSVDLKPKNNRFQAGFLSKKTDGSPPKFMGLTSSSSSDNDTSPLRTIEANRGSQPPTRSTLSVMELASPSNENSIMGGGGSGSDKLNNDSGNTSGCGSDTENTFVSHTDAARIRAALKQNRTSNAHHVHHTAASAARSARRSRSPTMGSGSPPSRPGSGHGSENGSADGSGRGPMFTAGQARRMVRSERGDVMANVLSPRTGGGASVTKSAGARRTTISSELRQGNTPMSAVRLSGTVGSTPRVRESVAGITGTAGKGWR